MTAYVSHICYAAFLLEDTGVNISEDDIILAITARLPHSYNQFLVSLDTLSDSDYTLNVVITRLNNEYQRQHMYSRPPSEPSTDTLRPQAGNEALSAMAPTTRIGHITCFTCGYKGHYQINCPPRTPGNPISNPAINPASPIKPQGNASLAEDDWDADVSL